MAEAVYLLCAGTSLFCAFLLIRQYRRNRIHLLLWTSLCFAGLALNNVLLVMDLMVISSVSLSIPRTVAALIGLALMVFGLVWNAK